MEKVTKAVKFGIEENKELRNLLAKFRDMINFCIDKGLEKNITSRFKLIKEVYQEAKKFGLHTHYILNACTVACAILKNYRKAKRKNGEAKKPEAKKLFLELDNQTFKLIKKDDLYLRIPTKPKEFLFIKLKYGDYQKQFLNEEYKVGSVIIGCEHVIITFSKIEVKLKEPKRVTAIDINEENITCVSSDGFVKVYDLKKVKTIHYTYYLKRKSIQRKVRSRKLRLKLLKKYSGKEKRKKEWILHNISKKIVEDFPESEFVLENLKGIRKAINKRRLRTKPKKLIRRLNSWSFRKIQGFIEYKALWSGLKVSYLNPKLTSSICPICGLRVEPNGYRMLKCNNCNLEMNRDILACFNLLKMKGIRFPPDRLIMTSTSYEGVSKGEPFCRTKAYKGFF